MQCSKMVYSPFQVQQKMSNVTLRGYGTQMCRAVVWHINCYVVAITTNQFLITKQQYNNPTESNSEPAFTFGLTIFLQLVRV